MKIARRRTFGSRVCLKQVTDTCINADFGGLFELGGRVDRLSTDYLREWVTKIFYGAGYQGIRLTYGQCCSSLHRRAIMALDCGDPVMSSLRIFFHGPLHVARMFNIMDEERRYLASSLTSMDAESVNSH